MTKGRSERQRGAAASSATAPAGSEGSGGGVGELEEIRRELKEIGSRVEDLYGAEAVVEDLRYGMARL